MTGPASIKMGSEQLCLVRLGYRPGQWKRSNACLLGHSVVSDSLRPPWTVAHQASLSMGFPRQECWSGLPSASPGDLPNPRIMDSPVSSALQADSLILSHQGTPKMLEVIYV